MTHFVVSTNGSFGDVHPHFGIAHALAGRGHEVTVVSNPKYTRLAGDLEMRPASSAAAVDAVIDKMNVKMAMSSMGDLMRGLLVEPMEDFYRTIEGANRPGESVLVAFPLVTGARLAQEALGIPYAGCQLAPSAFRSALDAPRMTAAKMPSWTPSWVYRSMFSMVDVMVDRTVKAPINAFREELGLEPVSRIFSWMDSPTLTLGLFPEWFAARQADWPEHAVTSQFPLFDAASARPLSAEMAAFLDAGDPPVVVSAGSPASGIGSFYAAAAEACAALGRRGVLVTPHEDDVPPDLPDGVVHARYAPYGALLPRAAAMIGHGGIGTLAQALRAGIPQLIVPWGVDQFDNSIRLQRLGVARELPFARVTAKRLTAKLGELLEDEDMAARAREIGGRFEGVDPAAAACEALEAFADRSLPR